MTLQIPSLLVLPSERVTLRDAARLRSAEHKEHASRALTTGNQYVPRRLRDLPVAAPSTNASGQPIAQTVPALANFWRWFGESELVDGYARPMVQYVGGSSVHDAPPGTLTRFYGPGAGWCFGSRICAERDSVGAALTFGGQSVVRPVYVRLVRPFVVRDGIGEDGKRIPARLSHEQAAELAGEARAAGYDGVVWTVLGTFGRGHAFNLSQLKSTRNRGTFDPNNPDIFA